MVGDPLSDGDLMAPDQLSYRAVGRPGSGGELGEGTVHQAPGLAHGFDVSGRVRAGPVPDDLRRQSVGASQDRRWCPGILGRDLLVHAKPALRIGVSLGWERLVPERRVVAGEGQVPEL